MSPTTDSKSPDWLVWRRVLMLEQMLVQYQFKLGLIRRIWLALRIWFRARPVVRFE
jgi:hypothetical protein